MKNLFYKFILHRVFTFSQKNNSSENALFNFLYFLFALIIFPKRYFKKIYKIKHRTNVKLKSQRSYPNL